MCVFLIKMHMFHVMKYERKLWLKDSRILKGVNVIFFNIHDVIFIEFFCRHKYFFHYLFYSCEMCYIITVYLYNI